MQLREFYRAVLGFGVALLVVAGCGTAITGDAGVPDSGPNLHRTTASQDPVFPPVAGIPVFNVKTQGALGDGSHDDRAAIKAAHDAACAVGGGIVFFPAGTYEVTKTGVNSWALQITCANITFQGAPGGLSVIQLATGSSGTGASSATDLIEILGVKDDAIRDIVLDGHWGNAFTRVSQASNNQVLTGTYTLNVITTTGSVVGHSAFPAAGPYTLLVMSTAGQQTVTCNAKTSNTFTTCTGGSGTINRDAQVALATTNTNTGGFSFNSKFDSDPNSDGLLLRGPTNLLVENVTIRNVYGDCVSVNGNNVNHDLLAINNRFNNVKCDMAARHGYNVNGAFGLDIDHTYVTNVIGSDIFSQPFIGPVRDVQIEHSYLGDGLGAQTVAVSIDGGGSNGGWAVLGATLRNWRFVDNTFKGGFSAVSVFDIVVEANHSVIDYSTAGKANILVEFGGGDITVKDNWTYNRSSNSGIDGGADTGNIVIWNYPTTDGHGNSVHYCPSRVQVTGNTIYARNSRHGVMLLAPGCLVNNATGTATSVTDTTLVDTNATWTDAEWLGAYVRVGNAVAAVSSSTGCPTSVVSPGSPCTLTLTLQISTTTTAWSNFYGAFVPTPAAGTYLIHHDTGVAEISSNSIDLADDGNGAGSAGIYLTTSTNDSPGMRVAIRNNKIQNANPDGIYINFGDNVITFPLLDIEGNIGWDDQSTHTFTNLITTNNNAAVTKWVMGGNILGENVTYNITHTQVFTALASNNQLTFTQAHGLSTGQGPIHVTTNNTLPAPLAINTDYYVIKIDSTHIELATSQANAIAGTNIDLTTNGSGTETLRTLNFAPGSWWTADGGTTGATCLGGYPSIDHGTLAVGSTNCVGAVTGVGANTSVTLAFSGAWDHAPSCAFAMNSSATPEIIIVTNSATAPTFSCISTTSGNPANCVDFSYHCLGQ